MKRPLIIATAAALLTVSVPPVLASNQNAKLLLHLSAPVRTLSCTGVQAHPPCDNAVTAGGLYPAHIYYAYVLVGDGDASVGIDALQFGIQYGSGQADGVGLDIFSWTLCGTSEGGAPVPPWPSSGSSNHIFWDNVTRCQRNEPGGPGTGVVATCGYFYCSAYSPATLQLKPFFSAGYPNDPYNNTVLVGDCSNNASGFAVIYDGAHPPTPSTLGFATFSQSGTEPGYNPCLQVIPVQETTWSRVKTVRGF